MNHPGAAPGGAGIQKGTMFPRSLLCLLIIAGIGSGCTTVGLGLPAGTEAGSLPLGSYHIEMPNAKRPVPLVLEDRAGEVMAIVNRHDAGVATLHQRGDLQVVQVRLVDYKNEFPGHQRWMYLAYESGTAGFVLRPFPSYKKDRVSTFVGATVAITTKAGEKSTTTWRFFSVPDAAAQAALSVAVFDRSSYADAPVLVVTPAPSATVSATATGPALR